MRAGPIGMPAVRPPLTYKVSGGRWPVNHGGGRAALERLDGDALELIDDVVTEPGTGSALSTL